MNGFDLGEFEAFEPMVLVAKNAGVALHLRVFTGYGVSDQPEVTEDHPLVPLTLYNKYKGMCEPLLNRHIDDGFTGVTFRPATVLRAAPAIDLSVNTSPITP
jgi:hypothetical protein